MKQFSTIFFTIFFLLQTHAQETDQFRSLSANRGENSVWIKYKNLNNAWYEHIHQKASAYIGQRKISVSQINSSERWQKRKKEIPQKLMVGIGNLPSPTPLNAKIIETLERDHFTVEKIIYESQPGFYVTACLFLPKKRSEPLPAVIYCSGHSAEAFRSATYQKVIINLVQKGFAVFAFDPLGQGERYQYLDENGQPFMRPTWEHSYSGIQPMLLGKSVARYMINDGIRAVDYLLTRPEIDSKRIGITGRSGGGTQSSYIAAFDERILAVAPENYITSFKRIWASIGPQDAEQNFLYANKIGIDHADLLTVRAPKPAMIITTYNDFFNIQGARETFEELKNIYQLHDAKDQLSFAEDDAGHASTKANRERLYQFFQKHLQLPGNSSDQEVEIFSSEELQITTTGQVVSALGSKIVFDLIQDEFSVLPKREKAKAIEWLKTQVSYDQDIPHEVYTGRAVEKDYIVERYFLEFENGHYPIPFLKIHSPATNSKKTILYLHTDGKSNELKPDGEIAAFVKKGYQVIAVDPLNIGELYNSSFKGDAHIQGISYNLVFGSSLVGTSLPMLQTQDLLILLNHLKTEYDIQDLVGIADHSLCIPLLQAEVVNPIFSQVVLKEPLVSWEDFLSTKNYKPELTYSLIPDVLSHYDIPDLLKWASHGNIVLIRPQKADGSFISDEEAKEVYGIDKKVKVLMKNVADITELIE